MTKKNWNEVIQEMQGTTYKGKTLDPEEFLDEVEIRRRKDKVISLMLSRSLRELASEYHLAYCLMASLSDAKARKPGERYSAMLYKIGQYLYEKEWNLFLMDNFDWPTPESQTGSPKTVSLKGESA